jgi:group I intron endonuclease
MSSGEVCTIYLLTNSVNGKVYVGQTWLPLHIRMGRDGSNYKNSLYLFAAIQKYGADKFHYDILAQCSDQATADYLEEYYINIYDSRNHGIGYNLKYGGSVGKHSDETKAKISQTLKEQASQWSPEMLAKRSAPIVGYWTGKQRGPQTKERVQQTIDAMKDWHANNTHPMLGKIHSEEAKRKIGEASKGRKDSPETTKKRSLAKMMDPGREQNILNAYLSGQTIDQIESTFETGRSSIYRILKRHNVARAREHKGWTGKQHSEESKQKMAEARKKYWEEKHE